MKMRGDKMLGNKKVEVKIKSALKNYLMPFIKDG